MPRLFFGNFEFEHELSRESASAARPAPPALARAHRPAVGHAGAELAWAWLAVAEADDFIMTPAEMNHDDFAALAEIGLPLPRFVHRLRQIVAARDVEFVPWGWSYSVATFARLHGWTCRNPPLDTVFRANSRAFRFELERQMRISLPGAALITSLADLENILNEQLAKPHGWLLKANFGMSGREALRGRGTNLDEKTRNWAQKRLERVGPIVFEPIVECVAEAGIQLDIPHSGPPEVVGVTPLLADRTGAYRGSRFGCPANELRVWRPAVKASLLAARALQRLGYYGPLGTDAMQYRDVDGQLRLRPLQDVNARYTMGRLALGFRRILPAGWCGTWVHFSDRHMDRGELEKWIGGLHVSKSKARAVVASPRMIGSRRAEHHAALLLAASPGLRSELEGALFERLGIALGAA